MTIRILELRSALGSGGGPEKTILLGAAQSDPERYDVLVSYIRDLRDGDFDLDRRAKVLGVRFEALEESHSFDPRPLVYLHRMIRRHGIDIVHAHDYKTDLFALLLCRLTDTIPLSTAHGWASFGRKERLYYALDKWLLRRFPIVVAVSGMIRDELVEEGACPERIRVIHNAVDSEVYRPDPAIRRRVREAEALTEVAPIIGAVGRLSQEKRFDLFIDVVAGLGVIGVLVGDGPERSRLEEHASVRGVSDRIHFLGHRENARDCHQAFDVYLQTSATEGVPNAVLEAMASGVPVVATAVGGTPEIVENEKDGLLVDKNDVEAMIGAVRRVLSDKEGATERAMRARSRVENELSFRTRMRRLEDIYDELMATKSRSRG